MTSAGLHRFYAPFSLNPGIPAFRSANTPVKRSNPITLFAPSSLGCCISSLKYRHEVKCGSDSGKNCLNSLQSYANSGKSCSDSGKSYANSGKSCSDSDKSYSNSGKSCSNSGKSYSDSVKSYSDSVKSCSDSGKSCSDSGKSQRLFNKQCQVITYCTFILDVSYLR